jgi:hypothetical protein
MILKLADFDFTLHKYKNLCCSALDSGYRIMTVLAVLQNSGNGGNVLVMRHDVDRLEGRAFRMALLEESMGIQATYYFRKAGFSRSNIIKAIADMKHEIGFHYEVLDEARGNPELAIRLFDLELNQLRRMANVDTICMHGNPMTKWINYDLWKYYDFHKMGLKGEAYLSLKDICYLSDTGRNWDMARKIKDILPSGRLPQTLYSGKLFTTDNVIEFIKSGLAPRIYITVHPERWSYSLGTWVADEIKDAGVNTVKWIIKSLRSS